MKFFNILALLKGAKFGDNSYIHPSHDLFNVTLANVFLGRNVLIGRYAWISTLSKTAGGEISIGDNTKIGRNFVCHSASKITIGSGCLFSYSVSILDHNHKFLINTSPTETGIDKADEISIGSNCFIGAHSFILKGVHLGDGCVVAANSVVNKSFAKNSIIGGAPAKLIRELK
jgi:acetyltransferase-like isoleucine patch superfamily enzyme